MRILSSRQHWLMQSVALLSLMVVKPAWSQAISDGSTGTIVTGGGVGCFPVCDITGGTSVGSNLFHSFDQFSVLGLGAARFFNNDPNIQTVISRVTGGNQSIIAGQLLPGGAFPRFDLVLINPSGITFRQGADISQLQGSFIASTANSVVFPGGVEFPATPTPPPLLAINVPLGLQYGANSQPIMVEASTNLTQGLPLGLPNTTLALVGSGLEVREFSRLTVRSSRMELGSVGANSFIGLVPDPSGWRLDYSTVQDNDYRDISMGELAVGTALGGDISVRGRTVTLQDGAVLSVRPLQPPFPARDGGILNVYGSLSVQVLGGFNDPLVGFVPTRLTAENLTDNQGSGWIQITTSLLEVQNGGRILSSTSGNAAGGTITIDATELELSSPQGSPFSSIASQAFGANRLGTGGNITINVDRTTIQGNAFISTSTGTLNRAGDLTITSKEFIKLIGYDNAPSTGLDAESRGEGNAGNITLTTNELIVQDYAQVTVGSQQGGNAGDLTVNAAKITMTNRGLLFGETNRTTGGNILLLPNLAISPTLAIDMNNSRVSTTANNAGLGGTITIADGSLVSLDANSRITSEAGGTATAGGIAISADTLKLRANSETSVSATGSGDAGNVEITARLVDLKASQITGTTVTGIGGNITIKDFDNLSLDFDNLSLDAASRVSTQTDSGQAGQISITGRLVGGNPVATVSLDGASTISSEATVGNGNAGNIAIQTIATLTVQNNSNQNNSKITTSVVNGTGGTIALDAAQQVNLTNSQITSAATGNNGTAGEIQVTTPQLTATDAQVTVSAAGNSRAGDVTVIASQANFDRSSITADTESGSGGNIILESLKFFPRLQVALINDSEISTRATVAGQSGFIFIPDGFSVLLDNSRITSESNGNAFAGDIVINTRFFTLNNSQTSVSALGVGSAGNVGVWADEVALNRSSVTATTRVGAGGNISFRNLDNFRAFNSQISAETITGRAGNVLLEGDLIINGAFAATVRLDASSTISSAALFDTGNAGSVTIRNIGNLTVQNNSQVTTSVVDGTGGTIAITANDEVDLKAGSTIASEATGIGDAGAVTITTAKLSSGNSTISTSVVDGTGGTIAITANDEIDLKAGSTIASQATGTGDAGAVTITTAKLSSGNSTISTSVVDGTGGTIAITANDEVDLKAGSTIASQATGTGDAGAVTITTAKLSSGNSTISTSVVDGTGGTIAITANDEVDLKAGSTIASQATGTGDAGAVTITTAKLSSGNSTISTSVVDGTGGTIAITANNTVGLNRSTIASEATGTGDAGAVTIATGTLSSDNSTISTSVVDGTGGTIVITANNEVDLKAGSTIASQATGTGNAGEITIDTANLSSDNSTISTSVVDGTGGTIVITANNEVDLKAGSTIASQATGTGDAGAVTIATGTLSSDDSTISTSVVDGTGGTIVITANNEVDLKAGSTIASQATGTGDAGSVTITTAKLSSDNSAVSTSVVNGTGGTIAATATTAIVLTTNSRFTSEATGNSGTAGTIQMTTPTLQITDSQATVRGLGNSTAGNVQVFANQTTLDGGTVSATTVAGSGGNITLSGQNGQPSTSLTATNTSVISASTQDGQGGSVAVQARQFILLDQDSRLEALASGDQGRPGDVTLTSDRLTIQNNARASVSAVGIQDAGNFTITAAQVQLDNGGQLIAETVAGTGGNIDFQGLQTLTLDNNSALSTSTQDGQGGNLPISATTAISLGNQSQITAAATGRGSGGIVSLAAPGVTLQDGAAITTTAVDGAGGSIRVNAPQSLQLARAARITTEASGNGSAGDIQLLTTAPFTPVDGVQITVSNTGTGNAGNLTIAAPVVKIDRNTQLQAITNSGQGGTISFPGVTEFTLDNNSVISTETRDGVGGAIVVNAPNQLSLNNGSKITSSATGNGNSGDIRLTTNNPLTIANGSRVIVNSEGTGQGGTIFITANALSMTNNTLIGATTESGKGGNINIQVADSILLRFNSDILTEARGAGDGGNMVLQAGTFIGAILSEDSDIIAGAVTGMGGRIDATALLTFGFRLYSGLNTPESDFTASSQFGINGEVNLNTQTNPAPEPLPDGFAPPSIANTCSVNPAQRSSYRQMGSGGISPLPGNALTPNTVRVNLVSPVPANSAASQALSSQTISPPAVEVTNPAPPLDRIVEAQGWIRLADGTIVLTANPTLLTVYQAGLPILTCGG